MIKQVTAKTRAATKASKSERIFFFKKRVLYSNTSMTQSKSGGKRLVCEIHNNFSDKEGRTLP